MARTLTQIGIETGNVVEAYHVSQSIDAFTGVEAYDISLSGSFNMTGPINGQPGVINQLTSSYAMNAGHAITASYAENAGGSGGSAFPFTGSAQITGSLGLTGSFDINKNISFTSGSDLPSAVGATAVYAGGYTTPNIGRLFIGDGTGWQFHFSRISESISADIVTIRDKGQVIISNSSASGAFRVDGDNDNPAIFSGVGAGLFAGITPKYSLESNLGSSAYNHLLVMRGSYISGSAATRRNGIIFKMSSETDDQESAKMGAIYLESTEPWSNNPSLCFATYNTERMRIDINGNVGIGKTSPSAKLDIDGNVTVTGSITTSNNITNNLTASWAVSSSRAISSSFAVSSSRAISSSFATTASHALNAFLPQWSTEGGNATLSQGRHVGVIPSLQYNGSSPRSITITLPNGQQIGDVIEIICNNEAPSNPSHTRNLVISYPTGQIRAWGPSTKITSNGGSVSTPQTNTEQPTVRLIYTESNRWNIVYYMDEALATSPSASYDQLTFT